jgi:ATP-binding cassette subfamily C protein/ATP-binding cassette subfamily C protein EexD
MMKPETALSIASGRNRRTFGFVGLLSAALNLLALTGSIYMMQVYDRVLATRHKDTLIYLTLIAAVAILALGIFEFVRMAVLGRVAAWIEETVLPHVFSRSIDAELVDRPYRMEAARDMALWRGFLASPALTTLFDVPWVPIYLAVIFLLHPWLGWVATAGAALLFLLTLLTDRLTAPHLRQANMLAAGAQRHAEAMLRNADAIDAMGMRPHVIRLWHRRFAEALPLQGAAADRSSLLLGMTKAVRMLLQVLILFAGALLVLKDQITGGAMIAASIIMGRALAPVEQMIGSWKTTVTARQAYARINAHLAQPPLRLPVGAALPEARGAIAFDRVFYALPGQGFPFIRNVSFELAPGETLAIIGPSAAGKTTLLRLLLGLVRPSGGMVMIDDLDVWQWPREIFGRTVGYLPQTVDLFDATIAENIARMAEPDMEQVVAAARLAGCDAMITALPQGYQTLLGEGGLHLSGGQRQMVGLARAFYGSPRVIVLDEPNSNLDGDAEAHLIESIRRVRASTQATVVFVSHRPPLVQTADKVMLMRGGMVEMFGPREAVLRRVLKPVETAKAVTAEPPSGDAKQGAG